MMARIAVALAAAATALAVPTAIAATLPTPLGFDVTDFGADATGTTDSTDAFALALAAARGAVQSGSSSGPGVWVPPGEYKVSGTINVTAGLAVRGAQTGPFNADDNLMPQISFHPFGSGSGTAAVGPCFELGAGSTLSGVFINYAWPSGSQPSEVPPAVHITGGTPRVSEVKMQGPWIGVSSIGTANAGRFMISDVFIVDAHAQCIAMGAAFDFSWLTNVECWAPTSVSAFQNGTGILLNGIDGLMASNVGVFRYSKALHFVSTLPGLPPHNVWASLTNVITDFCVNGLVTTGYHDITVTSSSFHSHETSVLITGDPTAGPDTGNGGGAHIRITGCDISSNGAPAMVVESAGETVVTVSGSSVNRIFPAVDDYALTVSGNNTQVVTITGCDIGSNSAKVVNVDGSAKEHVLIAQNNLRPNATAALGRRPARPASPVGTVEPSSRASMMGAAGLAAMRHAEP